MKYIKFKDKSKGGKTVLDNLAVSCPKCNREKGDKLVSPKYPVALGHVEMMEAVDKIPNITLGEY